jgi:hypothetical protein
VTRSSTVDRARMVRVAREMLRDGIEITIEKLTKDPVRWAELDRKQLIEAERWARNFGAK